MFRPQPAHHAHSALCRAHVAFRAAAAHAALYRLWSGAGPAASAFLQSGVTSQALRARKNAAAAPRPPSHVGLCAAAARCPRPCAVTSLAAGFVAAAPPSPRASAAPAPTGPARRARTPARLSALAPSLGAAHSAALAAPRALAFGSRAAAPRNCCRPPPTPPAAAIALRGPALPPARRGTQLRPALSRAPVPQFGSAAHRRRQRGSRPLFRAVPPPASVHRARRCARVVQARVARSSRAPPLDQPCLGPSTTHLFGRKCGINLKCRSRFGSAQHPLPGYALTSIRGGGTAEGESACNG
jgi:hypothetical protein